MIARRRFLNLTGKTIAATVPVIATLGGSALVVIEGDVQCLVSVSPNRCRAKVAGIVRHSGRPLAPFIEHNMLFIFVFRQFIKKRVRRFDKGDIKRAKLMAVSLARLLIDLSAKRFYIASAP